MASLTVENYVKTIFCLCEVDPTSRASTGRIAEALKVSPGTVTSMLKTLAENGLAWYTPYEGATLTDAGQSLALRMLRRHRLIELFLARVLELDGDQVHDDAEEMEHVASDLLIERIDEFLGRPTIDPHGDPIPSSRGAREVRASLSLSSCRVGDRFELVQVADQTPGYLRYLRKSGLPLGVRGQVIGQEDDEGVVTVEIDDRRIPLSHDVAAKLLVSIVAVTDAP